MLQPHKNLAIHQITASENPHTKLHKVQQNVVELQQLQVVILVILHRHLLPPKTPCAAAKSEFHVNTNNTSCAQASLTYNTTIPRDNSYCTWL
jgi:hypothetical protein